MVVHDLTQALSIEDVPRPEPNDGQVLVRIGACGLRHTDIDAAHGAWPIKPPLSLIPARVAPRRIGPSGESWSSRAISTSPSVIAGSKLRAH